MVVDGGPDLGKGSLKERRRRFQQRFDHFRSAIANEPRGSDAMVGALLCEPSDPSNCPGCCEVVDIPGLKLIPGLPKPLNVCVDKLEAIGCGDYCGGPTDTAHCAAPTKCVAKQILATDAKIRVDFYACR